MTRNRSQGNKRLPGTVPDEAALKGMYLAVFGYLFLTFSRLHEFVPALKIIRPLQFLTLIVIVLWFKHRPPMPKNEPLIRWQLIFLGVMLIGLPVVVNHFWWLNTVADFVMYLVVFSVGLVAVCRYAVYRQKILRFLLLAFLLLGVWALTHNGVGPRDCWLEDENDIAGVFVVGACLAYAMRTESPSRKWRWLAILSGGTCLAALIATASRGGFVALVVTVATIALFSGKFIRTSIVIILIGLAALPFVPASYIGEVSSIESGAESYGKTEGQEMERIYTWRRSWEMFLENPVIGVGAGNFSWAISKFESTYKARLQRGKRRAIAGRAAHSIYFTLLPELGVAGTLAYLMIMIKAVRRARNMLRLPAQTPEDGSMRMIALFVGPAIVGYSVAGVFISVLWYPMLWLLVSLAIVLHLPADTASDGPQGVKQQPLRILHIASGDLWAGAEVAIFHLACGLAADADVQIGIALLNDGELAARLRSVGIPVHVFDEQRHGISSLLLQVRNLIRRLQPQIVHTHRGKEHLLGALAAALVPGCISLRTVHGGIETLAGRRPGFRDVIRQKLDRFVAGFQRCAIAVSVPLEAELGKSLPGMPIRTIVNGIDRKAIQAAAAQPCGPVTPGRIGICFSGRLVAVKRVDIFLAAARTVLDAHPGRYVFYVIGDGPLRAQLEAQAQELQLGSDCMFTGFLPNALPLLNRMGVLVLTSDHEGTPMVALEALALGVPVVAHAVGGLVPLLGSAAQGKLVRSQDPAGIARSIIETAPPDRPTPAERHNLLPPEYRIENCVAAHLALYRELLAGTPKRR